MCPILFQALEITNKQKVLSRADVLGLQSLLSPLGLPSSPLARLWFLVPSSACPATRPSPTHPCMPRPPHCCGLFLVASHLGPQLPPLCYPFPGTPDLSPLLSPRSCYFSPLPSLFNFDVTSLKHMCIPLCYLFLCAGSSPHVLKPLFALLCHAAWSKASVPSWFPCPPAGYLQMRGREFWIFIPHLLPMWP